MTAGVYLAAYLTPLRPWLEAPEVTDIWVNQPGEAWIETTSDTIMLELIPALTDTLLQRLARQIAAGSHQGVNREQPLLPASLPDGSRVQIVGPPATRGGVALAVRKHTLSDMSLSELRETGLFSQARVSAPGGVDDQLAALLRDGCTEAFLRLAVRSRRTIVLSGGTSSGKTTLLNALIKEIDLRERLILIEDTPEIRVAPETASA